MIPELARFRRDLLLVRRFSCVARAVFAAPFTLLVAVLILGGADQVRAQPSFTVLHHFRGISVGQYSNSGPGGGLIEGGNGNLYGTTRGGGEFNRGSIFRMSLTGAVTVLYSFPGGTAGGNPSAALLRATDGNFYGSTEMVDGGAGTIFRMTPDGVVTILHVFAACGSGCAAGPFSPLVEGTDGNFYGAAQLGSTFNGNLFRMTPGGTVTVLYTFAGAPDGKWPSSFFRGADGNFYGITLEGGLVTSGEPSGLGTVFKMTPAGSVTILHFFAGAAARQPTSLLQARDGYLYGTSGGGSPNNGIVFRIATDGSGMVVLHGFTGTPGDGGRPSELMQTSDGSFFGTMATPVSTSLVVSGVFRMTPAGDVAVVHRVAPGSDYGSCSLNCPRRLVEAGNGSLYGVTSGGGIAGLGTAFAVDLAGTVTPLPDLLIGPEGRSPAAGLVRARDGNFYGTTEFGGVFNHGTIFRTTPSGLTSVVYTFAAGYDGGYPQSALVQANDGNLYGTTPVFGAYNQGIIFRLALDGTFTILHAFNRSLDGSMPYSGLIQGADGELYGTTLFGGAFNRGIAFRSTLDGDVTVLHSFAGGAADGAFPMTPLIQASDGNFYGTTKEGGSTASVYIGGEGAGVVFRMTPAGGYTVLHRFTEAVDGVDPSTGVIEGADGQLYGATRCGNSTSSGRFFRITRAGVRTVLSNTERGCHYDYGIAFLSLMLGRDGVLYGTMSDPWSYPEVFAMGVDGMVTPLFTFPSLDGHGPIGPLSQDLDGRLYGVSARGGATGAGTVYRLAVALVPPSTLLRTTSGIGEVRLRWTPVANATSYTVKRATASGAETVVATGVAATTFTDTAVTNGRRYYYIVTAVNQLGESVVSYEVSITAGQATVGDFTGDGIADAAVFRRSTGTWYVRGMAAVAWGGGADIPVAGDYDGDMRADIAVYRPSTGVWYVIPSSIGSGSAVTWGGGGDIPVPGDYDGDGTTDVAVFRPSTGEWFILQSSTHTGRVATWGGGADVPVARDFDGDAKTDIAVFRPSTGAWYILQSSTSSGRVVMWGGGSDVPVAADYDGDGKADVAVFRPSTGTWYLLRSSNGVGSATMLGIATDVPVPADYDGDGKTDLTVFRPSTGGWFINQSSTFSGSGITWGGGADVPVLMRP